MAHPRAVKQVVKTAYVHKRLSMKRAAAEAGVSYRTAMAWKEQAADIGDDWDRGRAAATLANEGSGAIAAQVLHDFLLQYEYTLESLRLADAEAIPPIQRAEVLSRLTDSFHKTIAAHAKLQPEISRLAVAMDVTQRLSSFIRALYPQHAGAFLEILEPFGEELTRAYA